MLLDLDALSALGDDDVRSISGLRSGRQSPWTSTPKEVYEETVRVKNPKLGALPRSELIVRFHEGRRQLPIVELKKTRESKS